MQQKHWYALITIKQGCVIRQYLCSELEFKLLAKLWFLPDYHEHVIISPQRKSHTQSMTLTICITTRPCIESHKPLVLQWHLFQLSFYDGYSGEISQVFIIINESAKCKLVRKILIVYEEKILETLLQKFEIAVCCHFIFLD